MTGVKKATILAREPKELVHQVTLGVDNNRYIIMTNFDYWNNDWREFFDPTANFSRRRVQAIKALDASAVINKEVLFETLNLKGVIAKDTIY